MQSADTMTAIAEIGELKDRSPIHARVDGLDLVAVKFDNKISVFYGRCAHRGALMADGFVQGAHLVCGLHHWDYRLDSGVSEYNNAEKLHKFSSRVSQGKIYVDRAEIAAYLKEHPQPYHEEAYQGLYHDPVGTVDEPYVKLIQQLASEGLEKTGRHGTSQAMGVSRINLPGWDDIQLLTAQLASFPLLDEEPVDTAVILGPQAGKPLKLDCPLLVSDMSYGALSEEAKVALSTGAERAGTGICSGEGGMLPEEQSANRRYLYELASGRFGFAMEKLRRVQAFHFKCGQAAKTGTGGHLPGHKVRGKVAAVRGLAEGTAAISPARFPDWDSIAYYREFAEQVREETGGIPIGFKLSAQHIEKDIDAALTCRPDYIILDGRGGGTGSAPLIFRDHISVPVIPALARARKHLENCEVKERVSLVITGGLRTPADFAKALALGADAVAVANAALQAIGCLGMRACHTGNCPVGIATQNSYLRRRLEIEPAAQRLARFFRASTDLIAVLARACGHRSVAEFHPDDLTSWKRDIADLAGIAYAGFSCKEPA